MANGTLVVRSHVTNGIPAAACAAIDNEKTIDITRKPFISSVLHSFVSLANAAAQWVSLAAVG
eukprot:scaffold36981_cov35-Attheya_sp.AAC.1